MIVSKRALYKLQKDIIKYLGVDASIVHYTICSDGKLYLEGSAHHNSFPGGCFISGYQESPEEVIKSLSKQISEVTP